MKLKKEYGERLDIDFYDPRCFVFMFDTLRYRLRGGSARFPMTGRYHFAIANGMRDSAISGLKDIGLRVEYSRTKQQ